MFPNYSNISFYLKKYKKKDPWDLVKLFEKKIANYSGSKYAVSTDCCTNAIFLCLKYSNKKSSFLTIPEFKFLRLLETSSFVFPIHETIPIPVITTLFITIH